MSTKSTKQLTQQDVNAAVIAQNLPADYNFINTAYGDVPYVLNVLQRGRLLLRDYEIVSDERGTEECPSFFVAGVGRVTLHKRLTA